MNSPNLIIWMPWMLTSRIFRSEEERVLRMKRENWSLMISREGILSRMTRS